MDTLIREKVKENLSKADFLVVSDLFMTETAELADVVLPALAFPEKDGTLTSYMGVEQAVNKAVDGPGLARSDADMLVDLARRMRHEITMDDVFALEVKEKWTEPKAPEFTFKAVTGPKERPFLLLSAVCLLIR